MKTSFSRFLCLLLLCGAVCLASGQGGLKQTPQSQPDAKPSYHNHLPSEPLPDTLDPNQFASNRPAFVSYSLAARIKSVLYQVPCYCGCDREQGHGSLLDCFTTKHGVLCHICQKEVMFCFRQQEKGKTTIQIREAMARGEVSKISITKDTNHFYKHILKTPE